MTNPDYCHLKHDTYGHEYFGYPDTKPAKSDCLWGLLVRTRNGVRVVYATDEGIRDYLAARTPGLRAFLHRETPTSPWIQTTSSGRIIRTTPQERQR
ncbi:hypothetical protein ABZ419_11260 [Streptomyces cinnamoneus]|uniref:hypothetical protein n=1 Tax=Streptomyces cinnamoneus TaxID=53446 RepID=UPI00340D358B